MDGLSRRAAVAVICFRGKMRFCFISVLRRTIGAKAFEDPAAKPSAQKSSRRREASELQLEKWTGMRAGDMARKFSCAIADQS
jgi:hypothetical protein